MISEEDRQSIFRRLADPYIKKIDLLVTRYDIVLMTAQKVVGKQLQEGRGRNNVLIRAFVADRLWREGFAFAAIGRVMHRHHASIIHYVRKIIPDMQALPKMYRRELAMYKKMNDILDNI